MFEWLKRLFRREPEEDVDFDWDFDFSAPPDKARVDFSDTASVERYIRGCCEQMKEATEEIEASSMEFNAVTERLRDMEEIEALPEDVRHTLTELARTLTESEKERSGYMNRRSLMSEEQYRRVERYEDDFPDVIEEFAKNEEYRSVVRKDLKNLEGEKMSCRFLRSELRGREDTLKSLVKVSIITVIFTLIMLAVLQFRLGLSVSIGYLLCVAAGAIALTAIFISHSDVHKERKRVEKKLNQAINMQNTVKIRYVNVSSLIDYTCTKYGVNSQEELSYMWDRYLREKKERERFRELDERAGESAVRLRELLENCRVKRADLWVHQAVALVDRREMVEIRHELVARRGSLRKRINYNEENRRNVREEVKKIAVDHPNLAPMIMDIVEEYEQAGL